MFLCSSANVDVEEFLAVEEAERKFGKDCLCLDKVELLALSGRRLELLSDMRCPAIVRQLSGKTTWISGHDVTVLHWKMIYWVQTDSGLALLVPPALVYWGPTIPTITIFTILVGPRPRFPCLCEGALPLQGWSVLSNVTKFLNTPRHLVVHIQSTLRS